MPVEAIQIPVETEMFLVAVVKLFIARGKKGNGLRSCWVLKKSA